MTGFCEQICHLVTFNVASYPSSFAYEVSWVEEFKRSNSLGEVEEKLHLGYGLPRDIQRGIKRIERSITMQILRDTKLLKTIIQIAISETTRP